MWLQPRSPLSETKETLAAHDPSRPSRKISRPLRHPRPHPLCRRPERTRLPTPRHRARLRLRPPTRPRSHPPRRVLAARDLDLPSRNDQRLLDYFLPDFHLVDRRHARNELGRVPTECLLPPRHGALHRLGIDLRRERRELFSEPLALPRRRHTGAEFRDSALPHSSGENEMDRHDQPPSACRRAALRPAVAKNDGRHVPWKLPALFRPDLFAKPHRSPADRHPPSQVPNRFRRLRSHPPPLRSLWSH